MPATQGQLEDHSALIVMCDAVTFPLQAAEGFSENVKEEFAFSAASSTPRVSWQPNKQSSLMASLVPVSFLSDLVMLFDLRGCFFF